LTKKPLIGISALHYKWSSLDEAFARALREMELDFIEFSTNNFAHPEEYERAGRLASRYGAETSLHAWSDWAAESPEKAFADAKTILENMERMEARVLVIHAGAYPNRTKGTARLCAVLKHAAALYEKQGRIITVENHYGFESHNELGGTPDEMLAILRAVDSKAVRFCLDYGHSHMNSNTLEFLEKLAPLLYYTHVADNHGENDEHLPMGEGTVDWPAVFRATRETGFPARFVIEFPEGPQVAACVEIIRKIYSE